MSGNLLSRVVSSIADRTSESVPRGFDAGQGADADREIDAGGATGARSDEGTGGPVARSGEVDAGGAVADDRSDSGAPSVGLYACPDCSTTYVSEGMDDCGACGGTVERVPNGKDLGHV